MTTDNEQQTLLEFPCDFTIKVIGDNVPGFVARVKRGILKAFPDTKHVVENPSEKGNYIAISAQLYVLDKPSLDKLYRKLVKYKHVRMVL